MIPLLMDYRSIFGHVDFLGQGATTLQEDVSSDRVPFLHEGHIFPYSGSICYEDSDGSS